MSKLHLTVVTFAITAVLSTGTVKADNTKPVEEKLDALTAKVESINEKIDQLLTKLNSLATATGLIEAKLDQDLPELNVEITQLMNKLNSLKIDIGLVEAKLDQDLPAECPGVSPNLESAITKELGSDVNETTCQTEIEIVTVTTQPFKLDATSLDLPEENGVPKVNLTDGPTTTICSVFNTDFYKCRHSATVQYTTGVSANGDYTLHLTYSCDPEFQGCALCTNQETISFTLGAGIVCGEGTP